MLPASGTLVRGGEWDRARRVEKGADAALHFTLAGGFFYLAGGFYPGRWVTKCHWQLS